MSGEPPPNWERKMRPKRVKAQYSGAPKARARLARGGAKNIRATMPRVPATNEPTAAMARAAPARPLRAI